MLKRKFTLLIGLIILMVCVGSISFSNEALYWLTAEERAWLDEHPTIRYSYDPDFAPFEFYSENEPQGMYIDVLKQVEAQLGIQFEMVHLGSWGQVLEGLIDKKTDIISASPTDTRREHMRFSDVYISVPTGIIIREGDTRIKTFEDLDGRRVSTVKGWSWNEVLAKKHPEYELVAYDTIEDSLNAIVYGDVDATILDFGTASYQISNSKISSLKVLTRYDLTQDVAYAVRDDYEIFVGILDKTIPKINEEIHRIQDKWIYLDVDAINNYDTLIQIFGISMLVLALLFIWSISLKAQVNKKTKALQEELQNSRNMQDEIALINQKLRQSEREVRTILDAVPSSIFMKDNEGRYIVANAAAAQTFGTSIENMVGKTAYDFQSNINSGNLDEIKHNEEMIFEGSVKYDAYFIELNDGKGNSFIHDVRKMPILDDEGKTEFILTVGSDVTEIFEKNQALEKAYIELKQAKNQLLEQDRWAAIGAFVAGIAHDINTPLGSSITINSHLKKLINESKDAFDKGDLKRSQLVELYEETGESVDMLDTHLNQAAELIQNFKTVSVRQINEVNERFDLVEYLNKIAVGMKYECKVKGVKIVVDCPDSIYMESTPGHISQVFTNLISNSLKHGFEEKDSGKITITAELVEDNIHLMYKDDGVGMSEEVLKDVFKPFYTTKRDQGGSGLGMHIVHTIITENLGGSIEANSQLGEGVQFDIYLPR